jgi:predicted kinase
MKEVAMWTLCNNKDWNALEAEFDWVRVMQEVPQDPRHHAEGNVALHTRLVLQSLLELPDFSQLSAQEQEILWASALLHDVEKYSTTVIEPDGQITAHGHARKGAQTSRQLLYRDISTPFLIRELIVALVRYHGLPLWILEKPDPLKALIKASMEIDMKWLGLLARADVLSRSCNDKADLLYRVDCFEEFCKEHDCWGHTRPFATPHARMHYLQQVDGHPDYVPFDSPEMEVILLSGLPGAGKDLYIKNHFPEWPVVSLDQLRIKMKVAPTDKTGNGQVIQASKEMARVFLRAKKSFVWNATNITGLMRAQLIELFTSYKAAVRIVYLEVPYTRLKQQNKNREAVVPANALDKLIRKWEVPARWEAHEVHYKVPGQ